MTAASPRLSPSPKDPTEQQIRAFEQRYGQQARELAAYAAFPLTLTTDLVYCLRETFLPDCPWYAAADLLLSGLCTVVGYDLYEMDVATRRYLLRHLRDRFGESQVSELERFMVAYLRHRIGAEDAVALLEPRWTALSCLRSKDARKEIGEDLQKMAQGDPNPKERFRLAALVESYDDVLDDVLAEQGFQHILLEWADRVAEGQPIDETAELAGQLQTAGFSVSWEDFEVAIVAFGAEDTLFEFKFETVTVNDRGEVIQPQPQTHHAFYFEEPLAEGVPPLRLVAIPSGEFMMGSAEDEPGRYSDESPQHLVKVSPFFISQYPVTQAQWRAVAMLPQKEQDLEPAPASFGGDDRPVERVSWKDAVEFCLRLSEETGRTYRLPTEAEWEYACHADTTTPFYFGETITTDLANYNGSVFLKEPKGQSRQETTPVGQFPANAFGLYDMHGNVWEWCLDHWHSNYKRAPTDGSAWLTEDEDSNRVRRGGSWNATPRACRSACRSSDDLGYRDNDIGFRVVCETRGL